jgi:hypothetical protein
MYPFCQQMFLISNPYYGAMLTNCINNWSRDPNRLKKLAYRMNVMGFPGEKFRISGRVTIIDSAARPATCDLEMLNRQGDLAVTAHAKVSLLDLQYMSAHQLQSFCPIFELEKLLRVYFSTLEICFLIADLAFRVSFCKMESTMLRCSPGAFL